MDYDMDSYLREGGNFLKAGCHYPDKYKLPNHITFSNESIYSNGDKIGGKWTKNNNTWRFKPSKYNIMINGLENIKNYFLTVEVDCILDL